MNGEPASEPPGVLDRGPTYSVCGARITPIGPVDAARLIVSSGRAGEPLQVHLCNAYTLSLLERDQELQRAVAAADLNLPDGTPVAWLGRRMGAQGPVRGPTLVREVMRLGVEHGLRHYVYGGAPGVADLMGRRLQASVPGVRIVGAESPPYGAIADEQIGRLADRVRAARAQVVWIGLGTPKQDYVVPGLTAGVGCPVVPVGAAFDYIAGTVKEAPPLLRGSGLEWMHRLATEPRRLWRRYLFGNIRFARGVVRGNGSTRSARPDRTPDEVRERLAGRAGRCESS